MLIKQRVTGFTVIELVVALVVFGVLLAVGLPVFNLWTQNSQVRTAAAAIQNGLQFAKAEAVRRNAQVRFQLTDRLDNNCAISTAGNNWVVSFDDPTSACGANLLNEAFPVSDTTNNPAPRIIQTKPAAEGGGRVLVTADRAVAIFNGFGRLVTVAPATGPQALSIDVDAQNENSDGNCSTAGTAKCLRVVVTIGGQIRTCDPTLPTGDPQRC